MNLVNFTFPVNLIEERKRFFSSKYYEPVLGYEWQKEDIKELAHHYTNRRRFIQSVFWQDNSRIVEEAKHLYQTTIKKSLLHKAYTVLSKGAIAQSGKNALHLALAFEQALSYFSIPYKVVISGRDGFTVRPIHGQRKVVLISRYADISFLGLEGVLKHEMAHIIRAVNSTYNNIHRSSVLYLPTEEGFASLMQDYYSAWPNSSRFQHAAEYVATDIALKRSFRDVYHFFCSIGFPKGLAFQRAIRHKFGFVNTAIKGDIMKPAMYFYHEEKLKQLTQDEILRMFVGKITVDKLPLYPEYKGIIPRKKIKRFFGI